MRLLHLHSTLKTQPFYPVFPLAESTAETFSWLSLWNFKEKSISHFLWHRQRKKKGKEAPANLDMDALLSPSLAKRKASLSYVVLLHIII
ncbi:hypothetical protein [Bilophila sp.]|uniref:hypothetical protein n=1 Tax=Bilophila sp. TaxID=1929485 RepID=UPI0030781E4D